MKKITFALTLAFGLLGAFTQTYAAPGLVVSGTELHYNGNKIFFSGMNLAWINYNSDVGADALDENAWRNAVQNVRAAGGNSIRWWLFNNMSTSPNINATSHLVEGLPANTIPNMKKALDIAEEYGVMVSMCLFSHNLMESANWGLYNGTVDITANKALFTDAGTTAFITNALTPVLNGIGNHNALMTWEIFNEAEGMTTEGGGWTKEKMPKADVLKFANKIASAIHSNVASAGVLVSDGCVKADYLPWWSDASLIAAGGMANGTMDFMQLHYYPYYQAQAGSPFHNTRDQMQAAYDFGAKPLIVGEFPGGGWNSATIPADSVAKGISYKSSNTTTIQGYRYPFANGYAGSMAWDFGGFTDSYSPSILHDFAAAKPGMLALYATDSATIKIKNYTPIVASGNGVMQVTYTSVVPDSAATIEYINAANPSLTGNGLVTFSARTVGASAATSLNLVTKSGKYNWVANDAVSCNIPAGNAWVTCSFNLSTDYTGVVLSDVYSFLLQNPNAGYSGVIQIDNFKAGSLMIANFDVQYKLFSVAAGMGGSTAITKIETIYTAGPAVGALRTNVKPGSLSLRVQNGNVQIMVPKDGVARIDLLNIAGAQLRTLHQGSVQAGLQSFPIGTLPAGVYQVRVQVGSTTTTGSVVIR